MVREGWTLVSGRNGKSGGSRVVEGRVAVTWLARKGNRNCYWLEANASK